MSVEVTACVLASMVSKMMEPKQDAEEPESKQRNIGNDLIQSVYFPNYTAPSVDDSKPFLAYVEK